MKRYLASLAAILLVAGVGAARAQEQNPPESAESQPGAARVSLIQGDVSVQRGDNGDWVAATVNTPVVSGDRVSTGQNSRAELQLDFADILRMSASATAKVADLERNKIQVQVGQGLVTYSVLKNSEAESEIDTPNVAIHPIGEGEYRILVNSDAETQVVVRRGSAEFSTPQGSTRVEKGGMITIAGTDSPQYKTAPAPGRDDWDTWNDERDHRVTSAESWRHTDRYYTGSEDLDANGVWTEVPDYGRVWVPRHDPDWAPYRDGRWVYEPYYGWTWISYEPWGWAPYHYGRWFVYDGDWVWWPGPVAVYPAYYPIWAPAYVSFFGFGGGGWGFGFGFGFGFGWGHVGWLPIGPGDWYHPWYGRWGGRMNVVNMTNIHNTTIINHAGLGPLAGPRGRQFSNINEVLTNPRVRSGLSSMLGSQFGRGAVPRHQDPISESSLRQGSMLTGKMPVTPTRASYSPTDRAANPSTFRSAPPNSQRFFTAPRTTSAANTQGMRSGMNAAPHSNLADRTQPLTGFNKPGTSAAGPSSREMSTSRPSTPETSRTNARPNWHTFTPPSSATINGQAPNARSNSGSAFGGNSARSTFTPPTSHQNQPAQGGNQGGWQHFTPPSRESQTQPSGRSFTPPSSSQRQFQPPASSSRGGYSNSSSRPPLNMRQLIVRPRNGSSSGAAAPRGGPYKAPSGGSHAAPSGSSHGGSSGGGSHGGGSHHSSSGNSGGSHHH